MSRVFSVEKSAVLFVIGSLDLGGSERHVVTIAPRLKQLGWKPFVYCLTHLGVQAEHLRRQGVEVIGPPIGWSSKNRLVKAACLFLSTLRLFGVMLMRGPRIVHFFLPMAYMIGAPLAVLARIPVRIMSRRSLNLYQLNHPWLTKIELRLHHFMHAVLGNSEAVVRQLIEEGCEPRRVGLIYNGIDLAMQDGVGAQESSVPSSNGGLVLIIVANLIPYKAHADLLRALAMISEDLPPNWVLQCVGRDTGYGAELMELAQALHLAPHIRMLGEQRDTFGFIRAADIGILCSHEEGFSNAILEGMSVGLPMVVTDVGGNAEAVKDGATGLVVPARDPGALGEAILKLAVDKKLRRQMGDAARLRVESRFSLERCVKDYDLLYDRLEAESHVFERAK